MMPVNTALASYSDLAYYTALALYLVAMAGHAVEYALARSAEPAPAARQPVAATGGLATLAPPGPEPAGPRSRTERVGRVAVSLTVLAAGVHGVSLLLRGLAVGRVPWSNMYEFTSAICCCAAVAWLVLLARQSRGSTVRRLGLFVLLPIVILLFLAGTVLYADAAPLIPALNSYWIAIHVSTISVASGIFLVSGVASILYIARGIASTTAGPTAHLPAAATLDRLAYRTAVVAFPIFTFAVIAGAIWAEAAWGRYWGWDPKETVALVSWVVYACYLHARATAGWRGTRAAWVNVLGFASVLFNLFFVNMVISGLHSYAGL